MSSGLLLLLLRLAMVLALYSFVGWGLYVIWNDFRRQVRQVTAPPVVPITLLLEQEAEARSQRFLIPEILLGRDPANDLHLDDRTISARHARLSFHHGQWWVEDLRSTNGTFLNQEPVREPLVLANGDQLRCGQVILGVMIGEPPTTVLTGQEDNLPTAAENADAIEE